jgi:hypothetical protein
MLKYTVAEALPAPEAVSDPPAFLVGAHVRVKPDTRPGIGPEHLLAAYGTIADVKAEGGWYEARAEGGWLYRVKSTHTGRSGAWIPEEALLICYRLLINLFVWMFVCLLICLLNCLFICLFVCLFVCLFACLFVCLFVCLFAFLLA